MGCDGYQNAKIKPILIMTCYVCGNVVGDRPEDAHKNCIAYDTLKVSISITGFEPR